MAATVAILSSTVINRSGTYGVECGVALDPKEVAVVAHFIGHPDTASLLIGLGAVPQPKGMLFSWLEVGQRFLAVPLSNPDRSAGWTVDQAIKGIGDMRITRVTRIA